MRPLPLPLLPLLLLLLLAGCAAALDPYRTLGVPRGASDREIKRAYRALARKLHPDAAAGAAARAGRRVSGSGEAAANARFIAINRAFETLSDPAARRRYDQTGEQAGESQGAGAGAGARQYAAQQQAYAAWAQAQARGRGGGGGGGGGDILAGPFVMLVLAALAALVAALPHLAQPFDGAGAATQPPPPPHRHQDQQQQQQQTSWQNEQNAWREADSTPAAPPFWHPLLPSLRAWAGLPLATALRAGCMPYSPATLRALLSARPASAAEDAPPPLLLLLLLPRRAAAAAGIVSRVSTALAGMPREAAGVLLPCWVGGRTGEASFDGAVPPPGLRSLLPLHVRLVAGLRRVALPRLLAAARDGSGDDEAAAAAAADAVVAAADDGGVLVAVRLSWRSDACVAAVCPHIITSGDGGSSRPDAAGASAASGRRRHSSATSSSRSSTAASADDDKNNDDGSDGNESADGANETAASGGGGGGDGGSDDNGEADAVRGWLLAVLRGTAVLRDATDLLFAPLAAAASAGAW